MWQGDHFIIYLLKAQWWDVKGLQPVYETQARIITLILPCVRKTRNTHFSLIWKTCCTRDKVCYKLKTCIVQTINSAYKGIFVLYTDKVSVQEHLHCQYEISHQLNRWDSDNSSGMWLLILEWDWLTWSHARSPHCSIKKDVFRKSLFTKSSLCPNCSMWGFRRWSSEQTWSLLHASPSTCKSISRDIASKVFWTQISGLSLTVSRGAGRRRARSSLTEPDISNSSQKKPC